MEVTAATDYHDMQNNIQLKFEAEILLPVLSYCVLLHDEGAISGADFAGVFILCYLGLRRPRSWSNGALKSTVSSSFLPAIFSSIPLSAKISLIPGLLEILGVEYLIKRMGKGCGAKFSADDITNVTVLSIFDQLQLSGIKKNTGDYVNRSIVCWSYGLRPFHLMFRIPSPLEVLLQQADGKRVITMFITMKDLERKHIAMLYYMDGMQNHAKDSLEFLLHDMKHMEHFTDVSIHYEQVGFFKCMLKLSPAVDSSKAHTVCNDKDANMIYNSRKPEKNDTEECSSNFNGSDIMGANTSPTSQSASHPAQSMFNNGESSRDDTSTMQEISKSRKTSPRTFFLDICGFDKLLWHELEYVISDM